MNESEVQTPVLTQNNQCTGTYIYTALPKRPHRMIPGVPPPLDPDAYSPTTGTLLLFYVLYMYSNVAMSDSSVC